MLYENTPLLETERLILRCFTTQDVPALYALLSDEAVNTFLPWFPLETLKDAEHFLEEHYLSYTRSPPPIAMRCACGRTIFPSVILVCLTAKATTLATL